MSSQPPLDNGRQIPTIIDNEKPSQALTATQLATEYQEISFPVGAASRAAPQTTKFMFFARSGLTTVHPRTSTGTTIGNAPPVLQQYTMHPRILGPPSFEHPPYDEGPTGYPLIPDKNATGANLDTLLTRMKAKFGDFAPIKSEEFEDKL